MLHGLRAKGDGGPSDVETGDSGRISLFKGVDTTIKCMQKSTLRGLVLAM